MPVIDSFKIKAASREAAEKSLKSKVSKNLFVHCNPAWDTRKGQPVRIEGLWKCNVNYEKGKR